MAISKITKDFRIKFIGVFSFIALGLLFFIYKNNPEIFNESQNLEKITFLFKALWCYAFTILGFNLLVLKICINSIHDVDQSNQALQARQVAQAAQTAAVAAQIGAAQAASTQTTAQAAAIQATQAAQAAQANAYLLAKMEDNEETRQSKIKWRYCTYYIIMIIVLAFLAVVLSINQFKLSKIPYLEASALLSFFLGYFIDSLSGILEKLGGKFGSKD